MEESMAKKPGAGGKEQPYDKANGQYLQSESGAAFTEKCKDCDSRDDFGQTVSRAQRTYRQNASYKEILAADKRASSANVPTAVKFNRLNTKNHIRHAKELGYKNQAEYEKAAANFFSSTRGKLYIDLRLKKFYRYEEKTRLLAVVDGDGGICTFHRVENKNAFIRKIKQEGLYEIE